MESRSPASIGVTSTRGDTPLLDSSAEKWGHAPGQGAHLLHLDLVRGMASIVVMLAHNVFLFWHQALGYDSVAYSLADIASRLAVLVFFMLSGFLIAASMAANIRRHQRLSVKEYLTARITRIYPPLIGAILVTMLACALAMAAPDTAWQDDFAKNLYLTPGEVFRSLMMENGLLKPNGPLWTLYMEFHLYLIAMCVAASFGQAKVPRVLWLSTAALLLGYWQTEDDSFIFYALVWTMGAAAFFVKRLWQQKGDWIIRLVGMGGLVIALILLATEPTAAKVQLTVPTIAFQLASSAALGAVIFACPWRRFPSVLNATSGYSYSLYVLHFPLLMLLLALLYNWITASPLNAAIITVVGVVGTMSLAALFAKWFEDQPRFKPTVESFLGTFMK